MSTLSLPSRSVVVEISEQQVEAGNGAAAHLTATDLAELLSSFNDVTARLQRTHETLQLEVVRLREELREANEQLQRSRRLAALGEMAAGIAHEVRNPLGSIRLYARMLEQDLADRPDERQIAGKIASAVGGLDAVVGDVLAFSRELRIRPEPAEGAELLTRALEACWTLESAESGIRIVRSDADPGMIRCDVNLIHQALVNVIRNALEAMAEVDAPRGGHELALACRTSSCGQYHIFRIADTGPGVERECLDRMFNPFFTTRATGTGLGLAIVHRIIDAHGGHIAVSDRGEAAAAGSTNGTGSGGGHGAAGAQQRGTIFELLLPRHAPGKHSSNQEQSARGRNASRSGKQEARQ